MMDNGLLLAVALLALVAAGASCGCVVLLVRLRREQGQQDLLANRCRLAEASMKGDRRQAWGLSRNGPPRRAPPRSSAMRAWRASPPRWACAWTAFAATRRIAWTRTATWSMLA